MGAFDSSDKWEFECNASTCTAQREAETEAGALDACGTHADNTGHFDFEIRSPDGEVVYP